MNPLYYAEEDDYTPEPPRIVDNTYVFASNIIERSPVVFPTPEKWQLDQEAYMAHKQSLDSLTIPKDLADQLYGKLLEPSDRTPHSAAPGAPTDEADYRSLYRKLTEPVYLIVKVRQEIDDKLPEFIWCFPTTEVRSSETVRDAAERTVFYHVGEINTYTLGNAPILHHDMDSVPANIKKNHPEVKKVQNFLMHSLYLHGKYELEEGSDDVVDLAWVTVDELKDFFTDDYTKNLIPKCNSSLFYL